MLCEGLGMRLDFLAFKFPHNTITRQILHHCGVSPSEQAALTLGTTSPIFSNRFVHIRQSSDQLHTHHRSKWIRPCCQSQSYMQLFHKLGSSVPRLNSGELVSICFKPKAYKNLPSYQTPAMSYRTFFQFWEVHQQRRNQFNSLLLLVSQDKESMFEVMKMVDKASGYVYGKGEKTSLSALMSTAVGAEFEFFKYPSQSWAWHWVAIS